MLTGIFNTTKAKTFSEVAKRNPDASYHLVLGLIGQHEFDKVTKTKTVATMMESMSVEGFHRYIEYLKKQFLDQSSTTYVSSSVFISLTIRNALFT